MFSSKSDPQNATGECGCHNRAAYSKIYGSDFGEEIYTKGFSFFFLLNFKIYPSFELWPFVNI